MKKYNVILDAGHGGLDKNGYYTTSPNKMHVFANGDVAYEGVLNRQIMGHLYTYLNSHPELNVITTVAETDPRDISLSHRVRIANEYNKDNSIFISIHCNASNNHLASGFELFTTIGTTKSDKVAEAIANSIESVYEDIGMRLRWDFSDGDKDKEVDFYVLRKTKCPAVLLEMGFFDHRTDFDILRDPCYQGSLAKRIYLGIINYINKS